ncbi:MAG: hypothetical protein JXC32_13705 [Anaerolineae bacterium]|nr:hypothetical protein [Anaerolineae bacterium]
MTENRQDAQALAATDAADDILLDLYRAHGPDIDEDLWLLESARWNELLFCLAMAVAGADLALEAVRDTVRLLARMNLVSLIPLASLAADGAPHVEGSPILITAKTLLERSGLTPDEAERTVIAFCEIARTFEARYEGKVQLLFRKYGRMMMEELTDDFASTALQPEEAKRAFATWLQNTLNMPVPVSTPAAEAACEALGTTYGALIEAADRTDINVAVVDELLLAHYSESVSEGGRGEQPRV